MPRISSNNNVNVVLIVILSRTFAAQTRILPIPENGLAVFIFVCFKTFALIYKISSSAAFLVRSPTRFGTQMISIQAL